MEAALKFGPVVVSGLCLLFTIIGCAIEQIDVSDGAMKVYLVKTEAFGMEVSVSDYACSEWKTAWQGAAAFAVLSVLISFVLLVLAVLGLAGKFSKKILNVIVWVVLILTSLIAWAIIAHNFHGTFCGASYSDLPDAKLAGGIALFILTTLFAVVGAILAFKKEEGGESVSYQSV